ncbi:hypothetical protein [Cytobacillus oceanisediminis]|uniref:hypothetical protein n=1 Tax=Cytobacillus oceanisediminis TaxID=665099 RepID=UPI00207A90FA|nr:hypothetical protein [Cytobacillus oceanisediminis]USK43708.1 hypothetical protein LIT27_24530 [Cytobacillus oceanisediminis]
MDVLFILILVFSIGTFLSLIIGVISLLKKTGKAIKYFLVSGSLFVAMIISAVYIPDIVQEAEQTILPVIEPVDKTNTEVSQNEDEPSQDELNAKLKEEAVQADFVELNVDNPPKGKSVYIDGEVSVLTEGPLDEFIITSKEDSGNGMYKIQLANTTDSEYEEGDIVRVYGSVYDTDESGLPQILGTVLEKHEGKLAEKYSPTSPIVSKAEADQIKIGMTYDEVVKIIGHEGTLERETKMSHATSTSYIWKNKDGSYAAIFFSDQNTGVPKVEDFIFSNLK